MEHNWQIWDSYAEEYEKKEEIGTIQGFVALLSQLNLGNVVLDLGCGPGLGAKVALSMASSPIKYVASDVSSKMLSLVEQNMLKSTLFKEPTNELVSKESDADIKNSLSDQSEGKSLYVCQCSGDYLPFDN